MKNNIASGRIWVYLLRICAISLLLCGLTTSLAAYPDLQAVPKPVPEPTLPPEMDTFGPPVDTSTPSVNAPTFAEWTRTGQPDDNLVVTGNSFSTNTGADLAKDTNFLVYGENTGGSGLISAKVQRLDAQKAVITLDSTLPAPCMYLLWAKNSSGYGRPVKINATDAWWLGPDEGVVGDSVSVYGRGLSYQNGTTTSWIYIQPSGGGSGQWVTPTAVNPYRVTFTIPNLSIGTYLVWVHNGHGQSYGWSGPFTLTVNTGPGWNSTQFNVKDYGAKGDGASDDTAAIRTAISAATAYSTVYFPAGTYMVSGRLTPTSNRRWQGAGKNSTTIKCASNFSAGAGGLIYNVGPNWTNIEIRDMTLDGGTYVGAPYMVDLENGDHLRFTNLNLIEKSYIPTNEVTIGRTLILPINANYTNYVYFANCDVTGAICWFGWGKQLFIDGCNFHAVNDTSQIIDVWAREQTRITNCTAQDYDNSNPYSGDGWGQGRFIHFNGVLGNNRLMYVADNTTHNLAVRKAQLCSDGLYRPDQNSGEQIVWEGEYTKGSGMVASATATTATFATLSGGPATNMEACIVLGTGLGQHRRVTGYSSGTHTITVSPAWNVNPDTTSQINCGYYAVSAVAYNNTLQGKSDFVNHYSGSTGVEPYGGCLDFVVANNNISQVRTGIDSWPLDDNGSGTNQLEPTFFNLYTGNSINNATNGIRVMAAWNTNDPGIGYFGNSFRGNTLSNLVYDTVNSSSVVLTGNAILMSSWYYVPTAVEYMATVFEHNIGTNMYRAMDTGTLNSAVSNTISYENSFSRGTGSGSVAVNFGTSAQQSPALRGNVWSGFPTTYGGALPGPVLETPYRNITVNATVNGSNVTVPMPIWNSGTASLSWTATCTTASWLSLSSTSGTIGDQNSTSNPTLTCRPTGLSQGTYTSTITITAASQSKTVLLTFIVAASGDPVEAPSFTPASGTYSSSQSVTISSNTSGATIRYTTDGSDPSDTNGTVGSSVPISSSCTLKAIACKNGMSDSTVTSAVYTMQPVVMDKLSDIKALGDGSLVAISSPKVATVSSGVYSDGSVYASEPDRSSGIKLMNAGAVNLWDNLTLTGVVGTDATTGEKLLRVTSVTTGSNTPLGALGMGNKASSASGQLVTVWGKVTGVTSNFFTVDDGSGSPANVQTDGLVTPLASIPSVGDYISATGPAGAMSGGTAAVRVRSISDIQDYTKCSLPSFSPAPGSYTSPQTVTISTVTGGATIRYTTDGSDPSETNGTIGASVPISSSCTLKAIAYLSGMTDSGVTTGAYAINTARTSWDLAADFSTTTSTPGQWTYGFAARTAVPDSYTVSAPGSTLTGFHDGIPGFRWMLDGTTINYNGDRGPYVGAYWGTSSYWIFPQPPTSGRDIYMMPVPSPYTTQLPVVRWTAPSAGNYSYTGSISEVNDSTHALNWWLVKKTAGGTHTTLAGGTNLMGSTPLSGSQALGSGDSLDILVDVYAMRPWAKVAFTITQP